jgi:hypothetical protein
MSFDDFHYLKFRNNLSEFCPFCYGNHNECECNVKELMKLSSFFTGIPRRFYAITPAGDYYKCDYREVNGFWSFGPSCNRRISNRLVERTNGSCLESYDARTTSFCIDHVPRCCFLPDGCDNFEECGDCYEQICKDCDFGACECSEP